MKLKSFFLLAVMALTVSGSYASKKDVFSFDEAKLNAEFSGLNELESKVKADKNLTYDVLVKSGEADKYNLNAGSMSSPSLGMGEPPLGIPSFLWGCVFGVIGILIVYLISEDKEETKKALYGCITFGIVYVIVYILVFASYATTTTTI